MAERKDRLWRLHDWANYAGIGIRTAARLNAAGRGPPAIRISRKCVRYDPASVLRWLQSMEMEQPRAPRVKAGG